MFKLKQLREKQNQEQNAPPPNTNTEQTPTQENPPNTNNSENNTNLSESQDFNIPRQTSSELSKSRKQKQEQNQQGVFRIGGRGNRGGGKRGAKKKPAELRALKDISEIDPNATPGVETVFPDPNNVMVFKVVITPADGLYRGARFEFTVNVGENYPYEPPTAVCDTLVYHPNIDFNGRVCLNILRADWKPVLTIGSVLFGLMTLFLEPNPDDPLNREAAEAMITKRSEFEKNVRETLRGAYKFGRQFPQLL